MKTYTYLGIFALLTTTLFAVLFSVSANPLAQNHEKILKLFFAAKVAETSLDKNNLKQQNSMPTNSTALAESQSGLQKICDDLKKSTFSFYGVASTELDGEVDKYCQAVQTQKSIDSIQSLYLLEYQRFDVKSTVQRWILFGLFLVFLIYFLYKINFYRIQNAAFTLEKANLELESRVDERTRDLKLSQEKILNQQQLIIAASKMSALGEMAAGIAHEINTPLAIIGMRIEQIEASIKSGDIKPDTLLRATEVVKRTNNRIAKIVSGLLFFARDGFETPFENVTVKEIVKQTTSFCAERFKSYNINFEIKSPPDYDNLKIDCRSVEISQVLLNLLNNSLDAIKKLEEKWITLEIEDLNTQVKIKITDSGRGIPFAIVDKIMQPFFTTKEVDKGTGLGLSISRGIVLAHGGKIYVDEFCKNTQFVVELPKITSQKPRLRIQS